MPEIDPHADDADQYDGPSKSAVKRQMSELQKLGEQLLPLPQRTLDKMQLPEQLMEAVLLAKRIKHREGRRRQLQYIGKIMRGIDAEPIRQFLLQREQGDQQRNRQFHELEKLRDTLLEQGVTGLELVITRYPHAERSRLAQLARAAHKEHTLQQPPKSARKLFRYLRELAEFEDSGQNHEDTSTPPDTEI
jgi:ribosome-associated protein